MNNPKLWGKREFWGVGVEYDPQWLLTKDQLELQGQLIELCRTTLRPNAVKSDDTYEYPRKNMDALASLGLLGLIVPKELGGRGESHRCAAMVVETIARYGCPSTALVYVMHICACATLLFRYHKNPTLTEVLRRVDTDGLIGTLAYSDPATGSHFWYHLSSKCWKVQGSYQTLKFSSWVTSAGFADWYIVQVISPGFDGDYSNMTNFLFFKDEIRANTDDWSALGLHGNQSGPLVAEALLPPERRIGPIGDGIPSNEQCATPFYLLLTSSCWNGVSMACVDLGKQHVTGKGHADVGLRVCDYPTIQDYFGEVVCDTSSARLMQFSIAALLDQETNNCDWSIHEDLTVDPRSKVSHWLFQLRFEAAKNVTNVTDVMLRACGGSGYKKDLGLERLLRDGKAGWLMAATNEVLRQLVGKSVLLGFESVDIYGQKVDERSLNTELRKMTKDQKSELIQRLQFEVKTTEEAEERQNDEKQRNDKYFNDPFSVSPVRSLSGSKGNGVALSPNKDTRLRLKDMVPLTSDGKISKMVFEFPSGCDHLGTFPGQYVEIKLPTNGKWTSRYISPTSPPDQTNHMEIVVRYENKGHLAKFLQSLKLEQYVYFRGPCGGFEYEANKLDHIIFICGGIGVTPAVQILRTIAKDKSDKTRATILYQAKDTENILFKSELDSFTADERIKVYYTLQDPDREWTGPVGHIGIAYLEEHLGKLDYQKRKVILCGGTPMAISCLEGLYRLRYKSEDIFIYGALGAELVRAVYGRQAKLTTQFC